MTANGGDPVVSPEGGGPDGGTRYVVHLAVDGREVALKPFIHDMLGGAIEGLVAGLRGTAGSETISLDVRVKRPCG